MIVDLWCHPTMTTQLTVGLRETINQFTTYRAREVWAMRISPWKMHAVKNSHIFRRWEDPVNAPDGTEITSIHSIEKRLGVNIVFPDESDRPSWDNWPVRTGSNIAKEQMVKIRGSQAQLPNAIQELEVSLLLQS